MTPKQAHEFLSRQEGDMVPLTLVENGWLMMAVWDRAAKGDVFARALYRKLKAHAIAAGVVWYYGDPWHDVPAGGNTP